MAEPIDISKITPSDLERNPDLLLHRRREPDLPIGPFDGRVGAVVDHGFNFVTSPNMVVVCEPHIYRRDMRMRVDFRYGADDPTLWPQRYNELYCHFAAIPHRPNEPDDPLQLFWRDLTPDDFIPLSDSLLGGLGHPSRDIVQQLKRCCEELNADLQRYRSSPKPAEYVFMISRALLDAKFRFTSLALTYNQLRYSWTDVQRLFLELRAAIDFQTVFQPRMAGLQPYDATLPPARTIGTVTTDPAVVQHMFSAGLPVWYLRGYNTLLSARINEVVKPVQPSDLPFAVHGDPPLPIAFSGDPGDPEVYITLKRHHRAFYRPPEPLSPLSIIPANRSTITSSRDSKLTRIDPNRPNPELKYLEHKICPPTPDVWLKAISAVVLPKGREKATGYLFPPVALFLRVSSEERRTTYIFQWLRFRAALLFRLANPNGSIRDYDTDFWRTLLTYGGEQIDGDTRSADRRQKVLEFLNDCGVTAGPWKTVSTLDWRGHTIYNNVRSADALMKEILWEVNELNFRFEFFGLFHHFASRFSSPEQRVDIDDDNLNRCFPSTGSLNLTDVDKADLGLGSPSPTTRRAFMAKFARVLSDWPGCPNLVMTGGCSQNIQYWPSEKRGQFEAATTKFYVKTFVREYGRLPAIPFSLSL
ncbi:hypothetical protein BDN72DRAFT_905610 [Pluteus cervinus]|uniref:Uncharacterized protein n=1 Tax=Pluteus cervinus TaxID=181527 RepID=A0ACD3A215_9AGAR|nr:hypothetical protein BDN72DRAFT_905610 [Pluteus cervinus]